MKKILIIEEERSIRLALDFALKESGFDVYSIKSFSEGHILIQSIRFNLIIANYSQFAINTLMTLLSLDAPLILLTDLFGLPSKIRTSIPKHVTVLRHPFSMQKLTSEMEHLLDKRFAANYSQ